MTALVRENTWPYFTIKLTFNSQWSLSSVCLFVNPIQNLRKMEGDSSGEAGRDLNELQNSDWVGCLLVLGPSFHPVILQFSSFPASQLSDVVHLLQFSLSAVLAMVSSRDTTLKSKVSIPVIKPHAARRMSTQHPAIQTREGRVRGVAWPYLNPSHNPFLWVPRRAAGCRWCGACGTEWSWRRCTSGGTTRCPSSTSWRPTRCWWTTSAPSASSSARSWWGSAHSVARSLLQDNVQNNV